MKPGDFERELAHAKELLELDDLMLDALKASALALSAETPMTPLVALRRKVDELLRANAIAEEFKATGGVADRVCEHQDFAAQVNVIRIGEKDANAGGRPKAYTAEITVACAECGERFRWMGLKPGSMPNQPMVSVDEYELRAPIRPASSDPDFGLGIPGFGVTFGGDPDWNKP